MNPELTLDQGKRGQKEELSQRSQKRKRFIVAATHIMERVGFHAMTMQMLADEVGASTGLAYQYFPSKEDVLLSVIIDILEDYVDRVPKAMMLHEDPVKRFILGFAAYCTIIEEKKDATILAYRESKTLPKKGRKTLMQMERQTTGYFTEALRDAIRQKLIKEVNVELVAFNATALAHMWALKSWHLSHQMTVEDYIVEQVGLMLTSILAEDKRIEYMSFVTFKMISDYRKKNV